MKRPLFVFTIYLFVFMSMAATIGPMVNDADTSVTMVAKTDNMQKPGSD